MKIVSHSPWNTLTLVVIFCLMAIACRDVIQYDGSTKVISRKVDPTLADSVLVFGKVVSAYDTLIPEAFSRVWTDEQPKDALTNDHGFYQLKLPSGTYTIHSSKSGKLNEFSQKIRNITLAPNEKLEINFYLGGRIE
jgi:hypothetical protein